MTKLYHLRSLGGLGFTPKMRCGYPNANPCGSSAGPHVHRSGCHAPPVCVGPVDTPGCPVLPGWLLRKQSRTHLPAPTVAPSLSSHTLPSGYGRYCRGIRIIFLSSRHILSNISKPQYYCNPLFYFFFSILSPNYAFSHKFPLKLLANGVICNTWYSSCSKPPPVYPGILLAPPAAKSCLQDTTRSAKSQPDSLHRPVFCKILLQGFAPPTIMYLYIISKGCLLYTSPSPRDCS